MQNLLNENIMQKSEFNHDPNINKSKNSTHKTIKITINKIYYY